MRDLLPLTLPFPVEIRTGMQVFQYVPFLANLRLPPGLYDDTMRPSPPLLYDPFFRPLSVCRETHLPYSVALRFGLLLFDDGESF